MPRGGRIKTKIIDDPIITETSSAEVKTTGPETINGVIVNALHVKARRAPSLDAEVAEVLDKGDTVVVLEKQKCFWKVRTKSDKTVYISSAFIEEDRSWTRT